MTTARNFLGTVSDIENRVYLAQLYAPHRMVAQPCITPRVGIGSQTCFKDIARSDEPFVSVASHLAPHIASLRWHEADVDLLHRQFDAHSRVNYDLLAETFAHRFFLTNYWKAAIALRRTSLRQPSTIVDLGCGSGAATAAALAWIQSAGRLPAHVRVLLVDRSKRQLAIAHELLGAVASKLPGLSITISALETEIEPLESAWSQIVGAADLVLASHLLTENVAHASAIVSQIADSMTATGNLLVVERPDDEVWARLPAGHDHTLRVPDEGFPLNGFPAQRNAPQLTARYLVVQSTKARLLRLIECYFDAWRLQSVDKLDEVFAPDATYQDKIFANPIQNLQGIRDYWRRRVLPQHDPQPRVLNLALGEDSAFIEWQTDLTIDAQRKSVRGVMVVELDESGERIGRLREHYKSKTLT